MNRFRRWKLESTRIAILLLTVTSAWCVTMRKCRLADWQFIPVYLGDAWNYAAWAKAASEGQFLPFMPKFNRYLNAPFGASWNDFPSTEDILWAATGLGARLFGLFPALNLFYLLACLLAATSFYLTARYLRYRWEWCLAGALAFGLSPYALTRGIHHLALTYYWHVPLCLLVTWWAASRTGLSFWRTPLLGGHGSGGYHGLAEPVLHQLVFAVAWAGCDSPRDSTEELDGPVAAGQHRCSHSAGFFFGQSGHLDL